MITWTAQLAILRALISETSDVFSDANMLHAVNAAILSVHGELFVPLAPQDITVTTGTTTYNVPSDFVYIDEIRDSSGIRLPDHAWELKVGTTPQIIFKEPYFTPTTSSDPSVSGMGVQAVLSAGGDTINIDPGYIQYRTLANVHSALGGSASDMAAWHQAESVRLAELAEKRLEDEFVLAKYRPKPDARLVPGRAGGTGTAYSAGFLVAASDASDKSKRLADYLCDGTDDDVQIQAAIDALPTIDSVNVGTIELSEGIFIIGSPISITTSARVNFKGQGRLKTILKPKTNLNDNVIEAAGALGECEFSDFMIDGNKANQDTSGHGIYCRYMASARFINIDVRSCKVDGWTKSNDSDANGMVFLNCETSLNDGRGWELGTCYDTVFVRCAATQNELDGFLVTGNDNAFIGCVADTNDPSDLNDGDGFDIASAARTRIIGCYSGDNDGYGINEGAGADNNVFIGNVFTGNGEGAVNKTGASTIIHSNVGVTPTTVTDLATLLAELDTLGLIVDGS